MFARVYNVTTRKILVPSRCRKRSFAGLPDANNEKWTLHDGITLSERCIAKLKNVAQDGSFLRVSVEGGGCSGFQYKYELDTNVTDEDRVFEADCVKVVVDNISLNYLKGSTLDYEQQLIRSAFRIVHNPIAEQGCSCGASFSTKIE